MINTERKFQSLDVIFELAKEKLCFQSEQWNSIDQKNAIVLAVYGIILAILVTFDLEENGIYLKFTKIIGLLFWLFCIIMGMIYSIASLWPRNIDMPPKISKLSEKYLCSDGYDTKNVLLSSFEKSIEENDKVIDKKIDYLEKSIKRYLPLSLVVTLIFVFIKLFLRGI
jgi:hypothetical protein